jgi:hypothetical protein
MDKKLIMGVCGILLFGLFGCSMQGSTPAAVHPAIQTTPGIPAADSTSKEPGTPDNSPTPTSFPLAEPGPFFVGKHTLTI